LVTVIVRVEVLIAIEVDDEVVLVMGDARVEEVVEEIETADMILLLTEIAGAVETR
jgi:hypothetical protein